MSIVALNPSTLAQAVTQPTTTSVTGGGSSDSFGSVVRDAINSMDQTQKASAEEMARAVSGDSPDLHRTIIALQTADLGFQFGLQVRNKVINAYEEIMRMQV